MKNKNRILPGIYMGQAEAEHYRIGKIFSWVALIVVILMLVATYPVSADIPKVCSNLDMCEQETVALQVAEPITHKPSIPVAVHLEDGYTSMLFKSPCKLDIPGAEAMSNAYTIHKPMESEGCWRQSLDGVIHIISVWKLMGIVDIRHETTSKLLYQAAGISEDGTITLIDRAIDWKY